MRINHNVASLTSLRHLGNTTRAAEGNLQKLSSGMRINSAADAPAELMISERMRAQVSGLNQAIRNSETSISMMQTAEGSLNEVSAMLINMRQLALHAANAGTNDEKMLQADQTEIENLLATLDQIAKSTQFGTRVLFDGSNEAAGVAVGAGLRFVSATEKTKSSSPNGYAVDIQQVAARSFIAGDKMIGVKEAEEGMTFVISEGGRVVSLNTKEDGISKHIDQLLFNHERSPNIFSKEDTENSIRQLVVRALSDKVKTAGLKVDVSINDSGMLQITHKQFGAEPSFSVTTNTAGILAEKADVAQISNGGKDVAGTIEGEIALGQGQELRGAPGTPMDGVVVEYNKVLGTKEIPVVNQETGEVVGKEVIPQTNADLVGDEVDGYLHVTQNSLIYQIGANQNQTVNFSMGNLRTDTLAKGVENDSDFTSLADVDVTSSDGAQDSLKLIDQAIDDITILRSEMGSFQKNKLDLNLKNLRVATENLTNAESIIRDTDMASEMSAFTKNQILLASGTAMAAQANQIPKSVLQLLSSAQ